MIVIETNLNRFDCGKSVELFIFFHNHSGQEKLVFQFDLHFPIPILHVGGAKKSVNSITVKKNSSFRHSVDIISHELGTHHLDIKLRCLNKPHFSRAVQIPLIVTKPRVATNKNDNELLKEVKKYAQMDEEEIDNDKAYQIFKAISERFNVEELRTLCFSLSIDYENLSGDNRSGKSRELVQYCIRHEITENLINQCSKLRPKFHWFEES